RDGWWCVRWFSHNGIFSIFFFQAEDGIRDYKVTGVQTCALPISEPYILFRLPALGHLVAGKECKARRVPVAGHEGLQVMTIPGRSEERRVGKECRSGWSADH